MKPYASPPANPAAQPARPASSALIMGGITRRVALLSWFVTLLTLVVFVTAIIPEQKRIFRQNLESKARSVAVSVQNIAAGAVINEDYSSVVDHCLQMLEGDPTIVSLVLARRDGFALVCDRKGWRATILDLSWHPQDKAVQADIRTESAPIGRAFHYARPFDYSGIQWGWIHVGLSLESYDRSVSEVYRRTGLLAVVCVLLSLLASINFARPLVKPLQSLEAVVSRVAAGDLSARAQIQSRDEIESLARSFNRMTDRLRRRDLILEGVRFAARQLLATDDWQQALPSVLAKLGEAADTSRAFVFENLSEPQGRHACRRRHAWAEAQTQPLSPATEAQMIPWRGSPLEDWAKTLGECGVVVSHSPPPGPESQALVGADAQSFVLVPILVRGAWWGCIEFDQCDRSREWWEAEVDSFRAAAAMLGAAIERGQTRAALIEAKDNLEHKVFERTRELRAEIEAKEQARAKLAEAQQLLMDVSRKSGMAEIATGVLHNVGNVLNSVNVSASLVSQRIRRSRSGEVAKLAALFQEHQADLPGFFAADPRARKVIPFLLSLSRSIETERAHVEAELSQMAKNIDHIKQVVMMQQSYAQVAGVTETLPVAGVVEDALRITESGMARNGIQLLREFQPMPPMTVDKHKILQILINLLRNARQALDGSQLPDKAIAVSISSHAPGRARIEVRDTGVGISPENLTRIFSYGFTTKRDGHGFGLHMSALTAKEMGGSLTVRSDGPGAGATFTLELPLTPG